MPLALNALRWKPNFTPDGTHAHIWRGRALYSLFGDGLPDLPMVYNLSASPGGCSCKQNEAEAVVEDV